MTCVLKWYQTSKKASYRGSFSGSLVQSVYALSLRLSCLFG